MLQAITLKGERIIPALLSKVQLYELRKKTSFICPVCKKKVLLKIGEKVTPHFAHISLETCPMRRGGEGPYHEKGKLLLYKWLQYLKLDVQLEAYIPEINRQPDLLITINKKRIAIEYQCARMSINDLKERMNAYKYAEIEQIWILGANRFARVGNRHYKIDAYTEIFIHHYNKLEPVLYYFCPQTLNFIKLHNIYLTSANRAIATPTITKLPELQLLDLFHIPSDSYDALLYKWSFEKHHFRLRHMKRNYSHELSWRNWLYVNDLHIETLPSIVYIPIRNQFKMKTNLWNWQSHLYFSLLNRIETHEFFSLKQCQSLLRQHMKREFSVLYMDNSDPVEEYLEFLVAIEIVSKHKVGMYRFKNKIKTFQNVEESISGDKVFIENAIQTLKESKMNKNQIVSMKASNSDILIVDKV